MISGEQNEYLIFLSEYFKVNTRTIIQRSIENNIISPSDNIDVITSKLQSVIGYQRRLLEPLSVAFTKSSPFDSVVYLYKYKNFENHLSLLIADNLNIFKLIYFKKTINESIPFSDQTIIKIDSCFVKNGTLFTNQMPRKIWFYHFPTIFTVNSYHLDNLPECIYDENYTRITNLVNIIGYFLYKKENDKIFCYIYTKELQIRLIPFKLEEITEDFSTKLVKLTYCELDYGPDAYQLKLTEYSEFLELSTIPMILKKSHFKSLLRFEYPSIRMSLSELSEKAVASTKVKFLEAVYSDSYWKFFGYDASQAVCIIVYDLEFGEHLASLISENSYFHIEGIYKRGKKFYLRERLENFQLISFNDEDDISIPLTSPDQITEEKLVILDFLVNEILDKYYLSKENKQKKYEKLKGICCTIPITINNYNNDFFQTMLVGKTYRLYFVRSKMFNGNLYFIMDMNSKLQMI